MLKINFDSCKTSSASVALDTGQTATRKFGEDSLRNFTDLEVINKTQNIPPREKTNKQTNNALH